MKKNLRYFMTLLLIAVASAAWAADDLAGFTLTGKPTLTGSGTDYSGEITGTNGETWTIALKGTDSAKNPSQGWQSAQGVWQIGANGNMTTATISTSGISGTIKKIEVKNAAYQAKGEISVTVGGNSFGETVTMAQWTTVGTATFEGEASGEIIITMAPTTGGRAIYLGGVTVTFDNGSSVELLDPELAFATTSGTVVLGESFVLPQLTNKGDGEVTYSSNNLNVATIDVSSGEVTLVGAGTATITASSSKTETYKAGSATFVLTVENAPIVIVDGKFDFTGTEAYGSGLTPSTENVYIGEEKTWTAGNVTLDTEGKYRWWYNANGNTLRFYIADDNFSAGSMTISAPKGKVITKIEITGGKAFEANVGTYENGTWTGSNNSVVLTCTGNSNVETVTVTYGDGSDTPVVTVPVPTFNPAAGEVESGTQVTIVTPEGASGVMYSFDGETYQNYTSPIEITEETTIYAKAYDEEGNYSEVVSAAYTLSTTCANIAAMNALVNGTEFTFNGTATVVYVNGKYVYIKDDSGSSLLFKENLGVEKGDVIKAGWKGTVSIYNNLFEVVPSAALEKDGTAEVIYPEATIEDVKAENMNQVVVLKGVTYSDLNGKNFKIGTITGYNQFSITISNPVEGATYDIEGVISVYKENVQFQPISITQVSGDDPQEIIVDNIAAMNALVNGTEFTFNGTATVVYVNGKYVYIKDDSGSSLLFKENLGVEKGDVIKAGWKGTVSIYNNLFEVVPSAALEKDGTAEVIYPEATIEDVKAENMNQVVVLKGVTYSDLNGKNFKIGTITGYNQFGITIETPVEGATYDIEGVISVYKENVQFQPIKITKVEDTPAVATTIDLTNDEVVRFEDFSNVSSTEFQSGKLHLTATNGKTYEFTANNVKYSEGLTFIANADNHGYISTTVNSLYGYTVKVERSGGVASIEIDGNSIEYNELDTEKTKSDFKLGSTSSAPIITSITFCPTIKLTVGETGYATIYYSDRDINIVSKQGALQFEASTYKLDENGALVPSKTYSSFYIPHGEAVVLKGTPNDYLLRTNAPTREKDPDNLLKGSDVEEMTTDGSKYYALAMNANGDADSVGFYWQAANGGAFTNGAHKAYLALPAGIEAKSAYLFSEDISTGINGVNKSNNAEVRYNMQGQRVGNAYKGVVIKNGKKFLQK